MIRGRAFAAIAFAGLLLAATPVRAACRTELRASVALRDAPGGWLIPVAVDGVDVAFVFDTGAERSMIFEPAADRTHVVRDEWVATTTRGVGGDVRRRNADPRTLTLRGVTLRRHTLAADQTLVVGPAVGGGGEGLLGRDFLANFDLEIDGPKRTLRLYDVAGCDRFSLPWARDADAIPVTRVVGSLQVFPVGLDGRALQATIDSGSGGSLVTAAGMNKLGLADAALAADPRGAVLGVGPNSPALHLHRFASMTIGAARIAQPAVWIGPVQILRSIDMLLGRDWLTPHHVWISFATDTVFVARAP